jgi:hypothetical protein
VPGIGGGEWRVEGTEKGVTYADLLDDEGGALWCSSDGWLRSANLKNWTMANKEVARCQGNES